MHLLAIPLTMFALALPHRIAAQDDHPWIAPTATDVRSPCPGLNTLANHGYLPRTGMNITISQILGAALQGFNVDADAIIQAAKFGLLSGNAPETMNLDALSLHNLIEHDASLSRNDFALGDNLHFNETVFSTLANSNPGVDFYNTTSAGLVQHARLTDSVARNPNVTNTLKEHLLRSRESSLYLSIMGDPLTGVAPKQFVQIFFREERLPIAEGWTRPTTLIDSTTLAPLESIIRPVSMWVASQACEDLVIGPGLTI
ncbi:Cloroperoxidase [Mycena alexandri]|uniref:Cloroperoxidase n=1 Tax=Mycena alexandri TaxID=1745969 RepID=A0AAD6WSI6_9AGAR|nr:Cloroperoxidase [Mycena alexandri]KAJ7033500.1 Cloroperoxidase [Mycena alexandri]